MMNRQPERQSQSDGNSSHDLLCLLNWNVMKKVGPKYQLYTRMTDRRTERQTQSDGYSLHGLLGSFN